MTKLRAWLPIFFFANAFLLFCTITPGKISYFFVMRLNSQWHYAACSMIAIMMLITLWEIIREADRKPGKVWLTAAILEIVLIAFSYFAIEWGLWFSISSPFHRS